MTKSGSSVIRPIGLIHSALQEREKAPRQGSEGAPDAWLEIYPNFTSALQGITAGMDIVLLTWFHQSRRDVLKVHPRRNPDNPSTGVFATRSPDRPNPIGIHRVNVLNISNKSRINVGPLEAIDGTPAIDIKPVLDNSLKDK